MFNKNTDNEYRNKWKLYIFIGLLIILLSPYAVGWIISIPNDILGIFSINNFNTQNSWIGFFGSIISSVVSMIVLYITVKETRDLQEYNRKLQIKPILEIYYPSVIFLWYKLNDTNQEIKFTGIQLEHDGRVETSFVDVFISKIFKIINLSKDNSARNITVSIQEKHINDKTERGINLFEYRYLVGGEEKACDINKYLNIKINYKLEQYLRKTLVNYINDTKGKKVLIIDKEKIQKDEDKVILTFLVKLKYEDIEGLCEEKEYLIDVKAVSVSYNNKNIVFELN